MHPGATATVRGVTSELDPVVAHNRSAWDREVDTGNEWTVPVGPDVIAAARAGTWSVVLIGYDPVPRDWFPAELAGSNVLGLASGGGQQGPVLAAAGARVTVLDNSPRQLAQDRMVADRENLQLATVLGDMRDLSAFARRKLRPGLPSGVQLVLPGPLSRSGANASGFCGPAGSCSPDS